MLRSLLLCGASSLTRLKQCKIQVFSVRSDVILLSHFMLCFCITVRNREVEQGFREELRKNLGKKKTETRNCRERKRNFTLLFTNSYIYIYILSYSLNMKTTNTSYTRVLGI